MNKRGFLGPGHGPLPTPGPVPLFQRPVPENGPLQQTRDAGSELFLWAVVVTTYVYGVSGASRRTEPLPCGVLPYVQADGSRIELSYRKPS